MANVNGGLVANKCNNQSQPIVTVKGLLCNIDYKKRFEEILGKKAAAFISSVINIAKSPGLADCEPNSVVSAAIVAATLDLPIDPNLGFAYIVPYNDNKNKIKVAQFQMGYKGFIQLAQRSGQYKTLNAIPLFENEIKKINRLTGEIELNDDAKPSTKIIGYVAYFRLLNGFEKALYMPREEIETHAKRYSQSYKSNKDWIVKQSLWTTDFDSMATKTVIKLLLSKYGPLSIEMQTAIQTDQAVINKKVIEGGEINENLDYPDNIHEGNNVVDADFQETNKEDNEQKYMFEGTPFPEE